MYTVEDAYEQASKLYWTAYLLTAHSELSCSLVLEALDSEDGMGLICSPRTLPDLKRSVVTRALVAIRDEVTSSAKKTALQPSGETVLRSGDWPIRLQISQAQFEEAMLAINVFSRSALLLTVYEGPLDDATELLHCDRELVSRGREAGLSQLTRNLSAVAAAVPLGLEHVEEPASRR